MTYEVFAAFFIGHAIGFIMGAVVMYLVLRMMRKVLLEVPNVPIALADVREWVERNNQIRELNLITRNALDKISGNA